MGVTNHIEKPNWQVVATAETLSVLYKYTVLEQGCGGACAGSPSVEQDGHTTKREGFVNAMNEKTPPVPAGLEGARKIAEGVAGIFSAIEALGIEDPEVKSLCQVGAALTQNLSNELEVEQEEKKRRPYLRAIPVINVFNADDSLEGER